MTIRVSSIEVYGYIVANLRRGVRLEYGDAAEEIRRAKLRKAR